MMPMTDTEGMTRTRALDMLRDEWLTVKEYAYVTRRHPEHIRQLCRTGKITGALRVGGQWRIQFTVAHCNS